MKIVFIINHTHRHLGKVIPAIDQQLQKANLADVQFISTLWKKHAIELARQATENGCDYLIAVGGDGTLHEVINGVLRSNVSADEYPVIGLLPFGSANDFARTAGISNSVEELINHIHTGSFQNMDVGKIILKKTRETRYFINVAGVGLSPEVAQKMEGAAGSILGSGFNYFKHIVQGFIGYVKKEVIIQDHSWQWKGKLLQLAVANGRCFGNAICIAPEAKLADGQFQVSIFGNLSIWDYLKNLDRLKKGVRINHPEVSYHNSTEVMIDSSENVGIEADGEFTGLLPVTISVVPKAIRFLMP